MKKLTFTLLLAALFMSCFAGDNIKKLEKRAKKNDLRAIVELTEYWIAKTNEAPVYFNNSDSTSFTVSQERRHACQKAYEYMQQLAEVSLKKAREMAPEAHFAVGQWIYIDGDEYQSQCLQLPDYKQTARQWWQQAAALGHSEAARYLQSLDETGKIPYTN